MKRAEKIALLNKILTGQADETTRQQLQRSSGPGMVAILFQPGDNTSPSPDDMVSFYHKGQQVTMPYKDIQTFTQYDPLAVVWLPDDGRRSAVYPSRR
ncbi:hypothetical protein [uncultured Spirosoma sp.]|uniref:hypothetical protein n=1 Tax=uncultured Spirosoma sp. TaxID=278208 RepID=UPI002585E5C6|nr:hypothetical protein [uncultured Spirosoma sp.]